MNILIADDENMIRQGIRRTIGQALPTCGIHLAASTEEAAGILAEHPVDIVLTDILMPGMDGLEFMRISKRKHPHLQWVVISAHSDFQYAQRAVKLGAKDYLLKPIGKKSCWSALKYWQPKRLWPRSRRTRVGFSNPIWFICVKPFSNAMPLDWIRASWIYSLLSKIIRNSISSWFAWNLITSRHIWSIL